jgi:TRAP-type C4-dicarboxylate transport system permease small subunit
MIADEIAAYPNWKTTIALKIPFIYPRLGIFIGFAFMGFYSALHVFLMLRAGPHRYAEALKSVQEAKSISLEVAK